MTAARRRHIVLNACHFFLNTIKAYLVSILYDFSLSGVVVFCVITQLSAVPIFVWVGRQCEVQAST